MHNINELPNWERLFKRIVWAQIGEIKNKKILDFGSGQGITANYYALENDVTAIEPSKEMLANAWRDNDYVQIVGDILDVKKIESNVFDLIICHNVLEYIDDKKSVLKELSRVLKSDGMMSIVKHNRNGRIMQTAVLLDDIDEANSLLDGNNSMAANFGAIRYYEDSDIIKWNPELDIVECLGIRTFFDLQQNQEKHGDEDWQKKIMQLEMRCSDIPDFRNIAFFHHILVKKKSDDGIIRCR